MIDVQGATPIRQKCYPISKRLETEMHRQVDDLLQKGVIVPSNSEWASPIVLVRTDFIDKNTGETRTKYRICIDYRQVNKVSKGDAYPAPMWSRC